MHPLKKVALLVSSFGLAFLVSELAIRVAVGWRSDVVLENAQIHQPDPVMGYRLRPSREFHGAVRGIDIDVHTNSLGLRGREVSEAKGADAFRILCLGDSITFGHMVSDAATYPAVLEERLRQAAGAPRHVEVLNGGISGYASCQCRQNLHELLPRLHPDLVLLCVGMNDYALARRRGWRPQMNWTQPEDAWSLKESFLLDYLRRHVTHGAPPIRKEALEEYRGNLNALVDEARTQHVGIVFLDMPTILSEHMNEAELEIAHSSGYAASDRPHFVAFRRVVQETAQQLDVPLLATGLEYDREGKEAWIADFCHPNEAGYRHMVDVLTPPLLAIIDHRKKV